jgi:hypothetical protein
VRRLVILFYFVAGLPWFLCAQQPDTMLLNKDSLQKQTLAEAPVDQYNAAWNNILSQNHFLRTAGTPVAMVVKTKKPGTGNITFYLLAGLVFVLALIKFFFARYFGNLFRVFFNTSLRQSQLTDQLLQAKLPSLFFNIFFILSGGFYVYFLLLQYKFIQQANQWFLLPVCIAVLGIIYIVKYSSLKFTGWITGYHQITDTYVFVIFLIAKIMGVIIIPFIVLMAFADSVIAGSSALISLLLVAFLLLLRFFRSYGLIQNQLKVSRFHFFLYIIGIEIVPLLLIYKGLLLLLNKNL